MVTVSLETVSLGTVTLGTVTLGTVSLGTVVEMMVFISPGKAHAKQDTLQNITPKTYHVEIEIFVILGWNSFCLSCF